MSMTLLTKLISQIVKLLAMAFFFYAVYEGVMQGGGSTSVFTGVGVLVMVLIGSLFIDKLAQDF